MYVGDGHNLDLSCCWHWKKGQESLKLIWLTLFTPTMSEQKAMAMHLKVTLKTSETNASNHLAALY